MFGCHNCGYRIDGATPYEKTPCATCPTSKNPKPISRYKTDPAEFDVLTVPHPSMTGEMDDDATGDLIKALSRSIRMLIKLKEKHPMTFKFVDAKMADPNLSYSDLAVMFSCKKQNVQYHLKKAVEFCPELANALIVDTRFSCGYSSLKEISRKTDFVPDF